MNFRTLTLGLGLGLAAFATAQSVGYAPKTERISAGILITPQSGAGGAVNNVPFVWNNLDKAVGVKPASWILDNPVGTGSLNERDQTRWGVGGGTTVGMRLGKENAPYWEVFLAEASAVQLQKYDVLLLPVIGTPRLTSSEREKIRRFMDKGGILWMDVTSNIASTDILNSVPASYLLEGASGQQMVNVFHPLMTSPNRITVRDLYNASATVNNFAARQVEVGDITGATAALGGLVSESMEWDSVAVPVSNTDWRTVGVAKVGDGFLVLTTRGISQTLNMAAGGVANAGFNAGKPSSSDAAVAAQKIAVNIISLASNYTSSGGGGRNDNSVVKAVQAPAIKRFTAPSPYPFTGSSPLAGDWSDTSTPVLFNGRVVTTQGNRVVVYDSQPNRNYDRDSNGNPDDGVQDPIPGQPEDIIWYSQAVGTKLSSPTVIENPNSAFGAVEQVWVRDQNSNVYVFDLNAGAANTVPLGTIAPPANTQPLANAVTPVTYHDGLAFISDYQTDNTGRVWMINVKDGTKTLSGTTDWAVYSTGQVGRPVAAPTVGYITIDDNSGGNDRVVYVASGLNGSPSQPPTVTSLWLGAKGEYPRSVNLTGSTLRVNLRASDRRLPVADIAPGMPGSLVVRMVNTATGEFATAAQVGAWISGITYNPGGQRGALDIQLQGAAAGFDWENGEYTLRVDYTIDWSGPSGGFASSGDYVRGSIQLPDQNDPTRTIVGAPALTPNGFLGVAVSNTDTSGTTGSGGSFYILKEKGRGEFLVRSRFELFNRITGGIAVRGGASFTYREAIIDEDNITTAIPFLNGEIGNLRFTGAPAVNGDLMFVTASGQKTLSGALAGIPADVSVLLAFKAEPPAPEVILNAPSGGDQQLKIRQPDMAKSTSQTNPEISGTLASSAFSIEPIPNSSQVRVVFESLASVSQSRVGACLANNLPFMVEWGNSTEAVIEPEGSSSGSIFGGQSRGTFNPLSFYTVYNGYEALGRPVATGDVVYIQGRSLLPDLLAGVPFGSWSMDGLLMAMDSDISANDPFLVGNSVRPWHRQYWSINGVAAPFDFSNANPSTNMKWPQLRGIRSAEDLRVRLLQARVDGSMIYGMAAGDDAIAVTYGGSGSDALAVFSQSDFLVVDSGRLARFDPNGNPLWSTQRTLFAGPSDPVGGTSQARSLSEPSRMYPDGENGFVYVDPGNNLVARIDGAGRESRTLTDLKVHPQFRPDGMPTSAPTTLRRPNDVVFWTTYRDSVDVSGPGQTFEGETLLGGTPDGERWDHWLIADTANNRVIEVIDRYRIVDGVVEGPVLYLDPSGTVDVGGNLYSEAKGVAIWHTPSQFSGKNYAYSSVYRQVVPDASSPTGTRLIFALGFNNVEPGARSVGLDSPGNVGAADNPMGYGGVLVFDGNQSAVISEFTKPPIVANTFIRESGGVYGYNYPTTNQPAQENSKLSGLRSVTARQVIDSGGNLRTAVMVSLQDGVYELWDIGAGWEVRWMLPRDVYVTLRRPNTLGPFAPGDLAGNPAQFRPMHARRLDSGDVLIVNGYSGSYLNGNFTNNPFNGEVLLVDGSFSGTTGTGDLINPGYNILRPNLGFTSLSVTFELPPVQGIRGIVRPVFAERQ